jgi:hypothetical protein
MSEARKRMDEEARQLYRVFLRARHLLRTLDEERTDAKLIAADLREAIAEYEAGEEKRQAAREAEGSPPAENG